MMSANEFYGMVHSANEKYFYKPDNHKPMKLQTTITQTKEIEITLPVFYKDNDCDSYIAILDEKTVARLYISNAGDYVAITNGTPDFMSHDIQSAIDKKWSKISEVDFLQAYDDALSAISLRPKLNYQEAQDFLADLNVLDLKRNGG